MKEEAQRADVRHGAFRNNESTELSDQDVIQTKRQMMITTQKLIAPILFAGLLPLSGAFAQQANCDEACLTDIARQYMAEVYRDNPTNQAARENSFDVVPRDFSRLPWGPRVRFTENNVAMMIGEGFWGAARGDYNELLVLPDAATGNVIWFGITEEHEQAAYQGMRLKVENRQITEVETYFGREGTPDLFAPTQNYTVDPAFTQTLPADQRRTRQRLTVIVNGYLASKQLNDGRILAGFTDDCARITNGVNVTHGNYWAADITQGCRQQLEEGIYKPVDRIRSRRFPVVNEETGVVVALTIEDHATRYVEYASTSGETLKVDVEYPNSRGMLELFKVVDGNIARIEGVSVFLPYYIQDLWKD
jgi:hypothetical protein